MSKTSQIVIDKRNTITGEEELLRLLSFPSCFGDNGKLTSVAFTLYRKNESYLSLNRLFYTSYEEAIQKGGEIKLWPAEGDYFCGYAQLNAQSIRNISTTQITLVSKYRDDFKGHAGICFLCKDGVVFVNKKGCVIPPWLRLLQQQLCTISIVTKI